MKEKDIFDVIYNVIFYIYLIGVLITAVTDKFVPGAAFQLRDVVILIALMYFKISNEINDKEKH